MAFSVPQHSTVQAALSIADSESVRLNSPQIGLTHLLMGILGLHDANHVLLRRRVAPPLAVRVLLQQGINVRRLEENWGPISTTVLNIPGPTPLDIDAELACQMAEHEMHWMDQREVNTGHLLLGILLSPRGRVLLEGLGLRKWRQTVDDLRAGLQSQDDGIASRRRSRYTRSARLVLMFAQEQARELRHPQVGTEHLMLAMLGEFQGMGGKVLKNLGADVQGLRAKILQQEPAENRAIDALGLSENYKRLLDRASNERRLRQHTLIGTGHLLYHMLFLDDDVGARALRRLNIRTEDIVMCLKNYVAPQLPLLEAVEQGSVDTNRLFTLTFEAQDAFLMAQEEAQRLEHRTIDTGHLLLALMIEETSLTAHLLSGVGLNRRRLRGVIETMPVQDARQRQSPYCLSDDLQMVVHLAIDAACDNCNYPVINPLHLLMGLLMQPDSMAIQALRAVSIDTQHLLMVAEHELAQRKR